MKRKGLKVVLILMLLVFTTMFLAGCSSSGTSSSKKSYEPSKKDETLYSIMDELRKVWPED